MTHNQSCGSFNRVLPIDIERRQYQYQGIRLIKVSVLEVRKIPVIFLCKDCGRHFTANLKEDRKMLCSHCGSFEYDLVTGRELIVEQLEVR